MTPLAFCSNAVYPQHDKVAKMLGTLKSDIAKEVVKSSLDALFVEPIGKGNQQRSIRKVSSCGALAALICHHLVMCRY